jgi:Flp pilus assembly pilin Flp
MRPSPFLRDARGSVFAEYTVLLSVVAIGCALLIAGLGLPLLAYFHDQVALLTLPVP